MSDDDFEDEPSIELDEEEFAGDLDEEELADDLVDEELDLDDALGEPVLDAAVLDDAAAVDVAEEIPVPVVTDNTASETTTTDDEDDDVLDLDEELHPDDVEEPLDVLLQERTASATLEDDEEELEDEEIDVDERGDGATRIVPRRADEFLCQSCFLVLPLRRLADEERQFCDDCA